ncbi:hypothetical protein I6M54_08510 [Shewanella algae]|nr:hypothetical protein [Shewanella algae]MBO2594883.1 hypothetical protein [Shewanella algae]MBO2666238.1 hypothetical protein [Shewanella algae]
MKRLFCLPIILFSTAAMTYTLETDGYKIEIEINCESEMLCDDVSYIGQSKKSGNKIRLTGRTVHTVCNDGVTPCTFQGYEFQNGSINYFVSVFGELSVTNQHGELILEQSGQWLD